MNELGQNNLGQYNTNFQSPFSEETTKKIKKWGIIVICAAIAIFIAISIANACIPTLSDDEIKERIIQEVQPQIDAIKSEYGFEDMELLLVFNKDKCTYKKPTIFSKGYIRIELLDDFYVSNSFKELDAGVYNSDTYSKYRYIDAIDYDDVEIDRYNIYISRRWSSDTPSFKDSDGDEYSFVSSTMYKNGSTLYGGSSKSYSSSSSSSSKSSSSSSKCIICNGSGYVRYYAGQYDEGTVGPCTSCNGTGRD